MLSAGGGGSRRLRCIRGQVALERLDPGLKSSEPFALDFKFLSRYEFKPLKRLREERLQVALQIGRRTRPQ